MLITMNYKKYLEDLYDGSRNYGICDAVQACDERARGLYYYQLTRYVVEAVLKDVQEVIGHTGPIFLLDDTEDPASSDNYFYPNLEATMHNSGIVLPKGTSFSNGTKRINRAALLQWLVDNGKTGRVLEIDLSQSPGRYADEHCVSDQNSQDEN